jgi:hypothetical protein
VGARLPQRRRGRLIRLVLSLAARAEEELVARTSDRLRPSARGRGRAVSVPMEPFQIMIAMRWACLALLLIGLAGCGGEYDPAKDPAVAPALKAQVERIEKLKQKAAEAKAASRQPRAKR